MTEPSPTDKRPQIGVGGFDLSQRSKELVMQVLDSNRITAGPMIEQFENEMAALHECEHALMCNSGTSALQIALAALKELDNWQDDDEVLVPALTFVATSNVVLYNNLKPVFVDVEPQYYMLDPAKIEEKITAKTRAIMPVHIGGLPCDMAPIMAIAEKYNLRVIEDSCETMFSRYNGKTVGSFGDISCFSTYAAHVITTAVGGLCMSNDAELMVMLRSLMNHGRDSIYIRMDDDKNSNASAFEIADRRFSFIRLGHSFRVTEMEGALGIAELENREVSCGRRKEIATRLTSGLESLEHQLQLPRVRPGSEHAYMFYPLCVINPAIKRDELITYLEENSVETRYLLPLINQPIYRQIFGDLDAELPVAANLNNTAFYIGCHPAMTDDDVDYVIEVFHRFFGEK